MVMAKRPVMLNPASDGNVVSGDQIGSSTPS